MRNRFVKYLIIGYFLLFAVITIAYGYYWYHFQRVPLQPIAFSHRTHINTVGLNCVDCHTYADKGPSPGIPPVSKCMSCHQNVKTESPEIIKLTDYWKNKKPLSWERIHTLPDHVYFTHKRHIKKGISCETCHGDVKGMDKIKQVKSLNMGWCVTCHRQNNAPTDCWTCHR